VKQLEHITKPIAVELTQFEAFFKKILRAATFVEMVHKHETTVL
jgi:hypothetical protein